MCTARKKRWQTDKVEEDHLQSATCVPSGLREEFCHFRPLFLDFYGKFTSCGRKNQGEKWAKAAQLGIEYDPAPMYNSGNAQTCDPEIRKLAEKQLQDTAMRELSFMDKLKSAGSIMTMLKNKS